MGLKFGAMEPSLKTRKDAIQGAGWPLENETWLMFPSSGGKTRRINAHWGIPPRIQRQWVLTLKEVKDYVINFVTKTETLMLWGYGVQENLVIDEDDIEKVKDVVLLGDGRKLNVMLWGRKPK